MPPQRFEQADHVGRTIALGDRILVTELRKLPQQVGLDRAIGSQLGVQALEEGLHQEAHLRLSYVVFGLRLRERHLAQKLRLTKHDLFAQTFTQLIGEVLHHHRLQAKAGLLPPLQQRAPRERF